MTLTSSLSMAISFRAKERAESLLFGMIGGVWGKYISPWRRLEGKGGDCMSAGEGENQPAGVWMSKDCEQQSQIWKVKVQSKTNKTQSNYEPLNHQSLLCREETVALLKNLCQQHQDVPHNPALLFGESPAIHEKSGESSDYILPGNKKRKCQDKLQVSLTKWAKIVSSITN